MLPFSSFFEAITGLKSPPWQAALIEQLEAFPAGQPIVSSPPGHGKAVLRRVFAQDGGQK